MEIKTSISSTTFSIKAATTSHRVILTLYSRHLTGSDFIDITPPEGGSFNLLGMRLDELKIVSSLIQEAVRVAEERMNAN